MASIEYRLRGGRETWRVVWRELGSKQQRAFTDETDAVRFRKLVEGSGNQWPAGYRPVPAQPQPGALTFRAWAMTAIARRTRATERTKADYRRDVDRHFELLNPLPLAELDTGDVADWLDERRETGLADKTIRNLHGFASSLYVDALAHRPPLALYNPFAGRLPAHAGVRTEEMVFLIPAEFDLVYSHVRAEYQRLIRLLYGTGLRYGEATALQVRDVVLTGRRKTLTVTKAWKRTGPSEYVVGEPKTPRSRRTLSLSSELVELLAPAAASRRGDELLFPGAGGGRLPHIEVYKRGWAPAVARANVCARHYAPQRDGRGNPPLRPAPCDCAGVLGKTPRLHDLRHSHVTALIAEGIALEVISRRLGHSSITITMDRYGHLDPRLDDVVNAAVDRVLTRGLAR